MFEAKVQFLSTLYSKLNKPEVEDSDTTALSTYLMFLQMIKSLVEAFALVSTLQLILRKKIKSDLWRWANILKSPRLGWNGVAMPITAFEYSEKIKGSPMHWIEISLRVWKFYDGKSHPAEIKINQKYFRTCKNISILMFVIEKKTLSFLRGKSQNCRHPKF